MSSPAQYRNEAEWLAARKAAIGGSDAAAVVGLDPYRGPIDVYREKCGLVDPKPQTPAMRRGRILEPVACELYTELTGRKLRRQPLRRHPSYPFIACSLDRQILANGDERGTGLLEVKAPGLRVFLRMKREGLPAQYIVQMQHNLGVWDYTWGSYAIFSAELWSLIFFDVQRDDLFVADLFEQEIKLWRNHIERRIEPPPVTRVLTAPEGVELPPTEGQIITRDDTEWEEAATTLRTARDLRESAEAVEAQARARVIDLMGEHPVVEGANVRVYYRQVPGRVTFDRKALEKTRPLDGISVGMAIASYFGQTPQAAWSPGELVSRLKECVVDFAAFEKHGKPFTEFRPFFLKPDVGEEE